MNRKSVLWTVTLISCALALEAVVAPAAAQPLPGGVVAYWRLDEGVGPQAFDSAGANHGAVTNPDWTADCRIGNCLQSVQRGSTYVTVPDAPDLDIGGDQLTLEAWIYPFSRTYTEGQGNCGWVLMKANDAGTYAQYGFCVGGWWQRGAFTFLTITTDGLTQIDIDTEGRFPANNWYHFVGVYDGSEMRFYINGQLEGALPQTGAIIDTDAPVWLGKWCANNGYDHCYHGKIDDAAIYRRALTEAEIWQHYQNGLAGRGYTAYQVAIDVKPGSYRNCINSNGRGVIPVAVLSGVAFDATQVDPASLLLDGQPVKMTRKLLAHFEDVNGDGLHDLVVQIADVAGTYTSGDSLATLTGTTYAGLDFYGTDTICVVP